MARHFDRKTVDGLVVEHLPAALRFALRLCGDADVAEDIVQEALCRVLSQWRSYREEAAFRTWMLRIVLNVDRDRRRRHRDTEELPPAEVDHRAVSPPEKAIAAELYGDIKAAIDALPSRQREAALLVLGEGLSSHEAAAVMQTSKANVQTCLHLARKQIARAIGVEYVKAKERVEGRG